MPRLKPDWRHPMSAGPELPATRHIVVGISDPSDDPSRHRVFQISAVYDATAQGWRAAITEENANAQPGPWLRQSAVSDRAPMAPTAPACLGRAVELIVSVIANDADRPPPSSGC